jgi:hypothetical protein
VLLRRQLPIRFVRPQQRSDVQLGFIGRLNDRRKILLEDFQDLASLMLHCLIAVAVGAGYGVRPGWCSTRTDTDRLPDTDLDGG